jgi:methylated-DNA-protein-cysteine methyltransferase-like protein
MSRSIAFEKIRSDVLGATASVPLGRVTTYALIGDHLEVMARHVSYILATLTDEEQERIPWHRVTGVGGKISTTNASRHRVQVQRLKAEGHAIRAGAVAGFEEKSWSWSARPAGPGRDVRKPYADPGTSLLFSKDSSQQ